MPFSYFLKQAIGTEHTHQVILKILLEQPLFLEKLTGIKINEGYYVITEAEKGLFDLGVYFNNDVLICLIEIKTLARLSGNQLDRQLDHIKSKPTKCFHLLLGISGMEYYKDDEVDELAQHTEHLTEKIGYQQLIAALQRYMILTKDEKPVTGIAHGYLSELESQNNFLENAWLTEKQGQHLRHYSLYQQMRRYLKDISFKVNKVDNAAGGAVIFNNSMSWQEFDFRGHHFEVYQEFHNNDLMIRIFGEGVPSHVRHQLKFAFLNIFKTYDEGKLDWDLSKKASKYHQVAVLKRDISTLASVAKMSELFKSLNAISKEIIEKIIKEENERG